MRHLDAGTLIDLVEQRLPEAQRTQYREHIDGCARCGAEYETWWSFLSSLAPVQLQDAPEQLIAWASSIQFEEPAESKLRNVAVQILFDSFFWSAPALGVRGAAGTRQLILRVEDIDVHLRISGTRQERTIHGQLLPCSGGGSVSEARLNLLRDDEASQSTLTNDFGEFCFRYAPEGSLSMSVELPSRSLIGFFQLQEAE